MELEKFIELEEKIKNILADYASLKKHNQELKGLLNNTELELEGAKGRIDKLSEDRDAARTRLDALISLLHDVDAGT